MTIQRRDNVFWFVGGIMADPQRVVYPDWRSSPRKLGLHGHRRMEDLIDYLAQNFKDCLLNDHPRRVAKTADKIAFAMGYSNQWRRRLAVCAVLHDMGKVHPECQHLYTSGHLQYKDLEFRKLVTAEHQKRGPEVLTRLSLEEFERYRVRIIPVCSHHHDDFLGAVRQPKEVYIVAVADTWDVLTVKAAGEERERGYSVAKSLEVAAAIMYEEALRGRFDPMICIALVRDVLGLDEPKVILSSRNRRAKRPRN